MCHSGKNVLLSRRGGEELKGKRHLSEKETGNKEASPPTLRGGKRPFFGETGRKTQGKRVKKREEEVRIPHVPKEAGVHNVRKTRAGPIAKKTSTPSRKKKRGEDPPLRRR